MKPLTFSFFPFILLRIFFDLYCVKTSGSHAVQHAWHGTTRSLRTLLYFLALKDYIHKEEHAASGYVLLHLQAPPDTIAARYQRRASICRFIISQLTATNKKDEAVSFSLVDLLQKYIQSELLFEKDNPPSVADFEEALLYLTKTKLLKIEGGFLVVYNTMQLHRIAERRTHYGKEQYRMLDEFYKQRIQQIHIVGEYANLMVRDYDAALLFVNDYFTLDYRKFINKYFKEDRSEEIKHNITPAKYNKLFGELSKQQLKIINDSLSRYIVVAAGPFIFPMVNQKRRFLVQSRAFKRKPYLI